MSAGPRPEGDPHGLPPEAVMRPGPLGGAVDALRGIRAAIVFLTRVPVGGFPYSAAEWRWSSAWFPLVGAGVGMVGALVTYLTLDAGPWPAATLGLISTMILTGGFHEDGLADTCDALGGAYDPEGVHRILKDSRVGTFGSLGLIASFVIRAGSIAGILENAPDIALPALIQILVVTHAWARVGPVWLMVLMPYATPDAAARSRVMTRGGVAQGVCATLLGLTILASVLWTHESHVIPFTILAGTVVTGLVLAHRFHRRVGGVTGDFLGATEQVHEMLVLLVFASMYRGA